jgi:hypothetical protein
VSGLLRIGSGLLLWAVAFTGVYGLQGLGCALGWQRHQLGPLDALRAALLLTWLGFLGVAALRAARSFRRAPAGIAGHLEAGLALVGAAAIAYTLFPVAWIAPCG